MSDIGCNKIDFDMLELLNMSVNTGENKSYLFDDISSDSDMSCINDTDVSSQYNISTNRTDDGLFRMRTLMDIDPPEPINGKGVLISKETHSEVCFSSSGGKTKRKIRGPYRRYTLAQIEKLFDLVIEEGKTAKEAALLTGINVRTAQNYIKKYNDDEEKRLPGAQVAQRRGRPSVLTEVHSKFLLKYVESNPASVLADIRIKLCEAFPGLTLSLSTLHRHLVQKCLLTLKKLEKLPAARNSDRVIALRKEKVEEWERNKDMNFNKNCVFIDEAGFNLHTQSNFGRSIKGTPAKATVPASKGISITILGAISDAGVIDVSLRKPTAASTKKRRADGKVVTLRNKVGTRTEHFMSYLSNVMDVLDKNNMKDHYLVMDNAPIHTPSAIRQLVESRGYKCVYLPPYSPFLNPIEEFWSKVKAGI